MMQNSKLFFHFNFTPKKLSEERAKIEKQFKDIDKDIAISRSHTLLPKLLERIRVTSLDKIDKLVATLSKIDIRLLIYEYPYPNEKEETRNKINKILTTKYTSIVGRTAWELFQHDITDLFLQDLIRDSYMNEPETFLGIKEDLLIPVQKAMKSSGSIIDGLVPYLLKSNLMVKKILDGWKVKGESVLEHALLKKMFLEGLHDNFIISRDGEEFVSRILEKFTMDDYKKVLKIYLENRSFEKFHTSILNDAIKLRFGDPRKNEDAWNFLSSEALTQVKRWVIRQNLEEIFASDPDNKRFNYWKRFIRYMDDVELLKDPKVAFIYFNKFVVVEYGNIGAAYFYHKEGFEKFILPIKDSPEFRRKSTNVKESMFKDRSSEKNGIKLFINKLAHLGVMWTRRFDEQMQKYLSSVDE
jgi:hypothetical protein